MSRLPCPQRLICSAHQPPPRADGRLPITITHLEMVRADWTERGRAPEIDVSIEHVRTPTAAFYRELYDRVGRPWLWYERRLLSDAALQTLLDQPDHELHVARHDGDLVGYFELGGDELAFFGLTLALHRPAHRPVAARPRHRARLRPRHRADRPQHQHARPSQGARHLPQGRVSPGAQRKQGITRSARAVAGGLSLAAEVRAVP